MATTWVSRAYPLMTLLSAEVVCGLPPSGFPFGKDDRHSFFGSLF